MPTLCSSYPLNIAIRLATCLAALMVTNAVQAQVPNRYGVQQAWYTQTADSNVDAIDITEPEIRSLVTELEHQEGWDESKLTDLQHKLTSALSSLKAADNYKRLTEDLKQQIAQAPSQLIQLRNALALPSNAITDQWQAAGKQLRELEARILQLEQRVAEKQKALEQMDERIAGRADRVSAIANELSKIETTLKQQGQLELAHNSSALTDRIDASAHKATIQRLRSQAEHVRIQRAHIDSFKEHFPLEHDLLIRDLNAEREQLDEVRRLVKTFRRNEVQNQAEEASFIAEKSHAAVQDIARRNADVAQLRVAATANIERTSKELEGLRKLLSKLSENRKSIESKVLHAPNATSTGIMLRQQLDELPRLRKCEVRSTWLSMITPKTHLLRMDLKDERRQVADPKSFAEKTIDESEQLQKFDRSQAVAVLSQLAKSRRRLLNRLIADQDTLLTQLAELEFANQSVISKTNSFREYLGEHVLWVCSDDILSLTDFKRAASAATGLFDIAIWKQAAESVIGETIRHPSSLLMAVVLLGIAFSFRQRFIQRLEAICRPPDPRKLVPLGRSLQGLAISALLSAGWPTVLLAIGYKLSTANVNDYVTGLGKAFFAVAALVWGCHFIRELCAEDRVGQRLFDWPKSVLVSVRRTQELTVLIGAPLIALLFVSGYAPLNGHLNLHRLTLISMLGFVSVQCFLLLRPSGAIMQANMRIRPGSLIARTQKPIWIASILAPLMLAAVSIYGYHYSATVLSGRLAESFVAILGLIVLHALVLRSLRLQSYNRRVRERERMLVAREDDPAASSVDAEDEIKWEQAVNSDIRDLLRFATIMLLLVGGWFIWSQVLPALRVLDRVVLWDNFMEVSEVVADGTGKEIVQHIEVNRPTTLMDGICAALVVVTALVVVRRLSSLLEFTVLTRLSIDRGGRHAIAIIVNYIATLAGLVIAFSILQLSWAKVQWLAAAMTVGLGFGLQEIFANLVSGVIILFERPIRAGDIVTVGNVTGTVSRMKMRATTITDFDRRELIVPNRTFITDNVINWTLSDSICRTIISVGVAYGSDTQLVRSTLLGIARRCPNVLDSPPPAVIFKQFGESTLDFELRVFIPHREAQPEVNNELNTMIDQAFANEGIEIAFPQQELRIHNLNVSPSAAMQQRPAA